MSRASDTDPTTVLSLLGDEYVQAILRATSEEARSAKALSETLDIARSTVYRRAEEMVEHDLLVERAKIEADGSHHTLYETNVDTIGVEISEGEFEVSMVTRETPSKRFARMWDDIRES